MNLIEISTQELVTLSAPYNPRTMSDHDFTALRRSVKRFGTVEPIVFNRRTRHIVGGHQRVRAALAEGIESLPVFEVDLSESEEKQLNLALNRIHGEWNEELLAHLLKELEGVGAELDITGFTKVEIDSLYDAFELHHEGLTDVDAIPEPPDVPSTKAGDLFTLGEHRVYCGDSARASDVDRLLGGARIHLVHTDPPYNVNVEPRSNNAIAAAGRGRKHHQGLDLARHPEKKRPTGQMRARDRVLTNDFLPPEEFDRLLRAWFSNAARALEPGRSFYFWGGYANCANYPAALKDAGLYFSQAVIWYKGWPVLTRKDFMGDHEWCFYGWKEGAAHYFNPRITNATDVWSVKKIAPPSMIHLTEKPVELAVRALSYSSKAGENILDLFGGAGGTLIAAERLGRRAFILEIDPLYCDLLIKRWEDYTGRAAKKEPAYET